MKDVREIAGRLTEAQRGALLAGQWFGSGVVSFVAVAFTDPWNDPIARFHTLKSDRLTPLGLAVRAHLLSEQEG